MLYDDKWNKITDQALKFILQLEQQPKSTLSVINSLILLQNFNLSSIFYLMKRRNVLLIINYSKLLMQKQFSSTIPNSNEIKNLLKFIGGSIILQYDCLILTLIKHLGWLFKESKKNSNKLNKNNLYFVSVSDQKNNQTQKFVILFYTDGEANYPEQALKQFQDLPVEIQSQIVLVACCEGNYCVVLEKIVDFLKPLISRVELKRGVATQQVEQIWTETISKKFHNIDC